MKRLLPYCILITLVLTLQAPAYAQMAADVPSLEELPDSLDLPQVDIPDPATLFDSLPQPKVNDNIVNLSFVPKVFAGYRKIHGGPQLNIKPFSEALPGMEIINGNELPRPEELAEGLPYDSISPDSIMPEIYEPLEIHVEPELSESAKDKGPDLLTYERPQWFQDALMSRMYQEDLLYSYMIDNPQAIEYAYWDLPVPPVLLEEDKSFIGFINRQEVPEVNPEEEILPVQEVKQIHWLHKVGAQLQFSQAYVSPNWYQGGNSYLSLLFGFNWNVTLNQVYHPNLLFQSDLTYKLAFTSNPKGYLHRYTISEDNFQYNLNAGLKAVKNWYYSLNLQFKTQLLNNYEQNSLVRKASFLSPGDLNVGLGMSYTRKNKFNTFSYTLTVSPLSYNLKTCISDKVDHAAYNIPVDKYTKSEIGSNLELNLEWKITTNIAYKTKVFMFTDYHYYLADWQNTFSFDINKFLSTQIFVHLRYDGSTENYEKWKKFMMREILSFGLSYTFSTKP